ncbi:MAG: MFS transporter [Deferribacteraceae bacterium]|jgi:EmrB/QacA subfamily drug resistance transporter|nr:MFS transporter [Deferribacteraceae bacterium]
MKIHISSDTEKVLPWVIAISFFMQMLGTTILNTALPSIAVSLGEDLLSMRTVVICFMLTVATVMPLSGWVADRFGVKNIFIFANSVFVLGSLLCALSSSLNGLIIARIIQGIGGAFLMPVGRIAVMRVYPKEKLTDILSFISMPALIGPLVGPTLGGVLVQFASWPLIFIINIPVGILAVVFTWKFMPTLKVAGLPRFDFIGFLMIAIAVLSSSLGIDASTEFGMPIYETLPLIILAAGLLVAYTIYAKRVKYPLFALGVFKIRSFTVGILGNICARMASGAMPFMTPLLLQVGLGFTPFHAGMLMMPMALMAIFAKQFVPRIIKKAGHRRFLTINTILLGCLMTTFAFMSPNTPLPLLILQLSCFGIINSMQFTGMFTVTLIDLTPEYASSGNSILAVITQLSMGISVGIAAAIMAFFAGSNDAVPISAFHDTYLCIGAVNIVAAFIFSFTPRDTGKFPN